ncbi:MAG: hypothetical protein Kow0062_02570 [Acidobacteriota bacterium]
MADLRARRKAVTRTRRTAQQRKLVSFQYEGREYVLDLVRNQVYQNWTAVETNRGVAILGAYRQAAAPAH